MATENKRAKQVGRKPKADPCRHRLAINLNDAGFAAFLALYEQSGLKDFEDIFCTCNEILPHIQIFFVLLCQILNVIFCR